MRFFNQEIERIIIIDAYTDSERKSDQTTSRLKTVLEKRLTIPIDDKEVNTTHELKAFLSEIENKRYEDGLMLFFNGHGSQDGTAFSNKSDLLIKWIDIGNVLQQINKNCSNQLVINTTCTCSGFGITQIEAHYPGYAHCVIGMEIGKEASLSSANHNEQLFSDAVNKYADLQRTIEFINDMLWGSKEYLSKIY